MTPDDLTPAPRPRVTAIGVPRMCKCGCSVTAGLHFLVAGTVEVEAEIGLDGRLRLPSGIALPRDAMDQLTWVGRQALLSEIARRWGERQ
jgi:hypothetical protein